METQDIALTALHPVQMQQSQADLIAWCERKITNTGLEVTEMQETHDKMQKNKWKMGTIVRLLGLAKKRYDYFVKIHAALLDGYYIVPNFPIQMFVIRTKKNKPLWQCKEHVYQITSASADTLPLGAGNWNNPHVTFESHFENNDKGQRVLDHVTSDEFAELEFPINMAKPSILDATQRAMASKFFDQIGIMPSFRKNQDPLIIGQILGHNKVVSFMIAWHLNTEVL